MYWVTLSTSFVAIAIFIRFAILAVYRLTWHPLAAYPGPWLAKVTNLYAAWHGYRGYMHIEIQELHQKYGSIIRIGPDRLVTDSYENYQRIYTASNIHKAKSYLSIQHTSHAWTAHNARNKALHPERRQLVSKALNGPFIPRANKATVKKTDFLISEIDNSATVSPDGWTEPMDFGSQALHLLFDIMSINCFSFDLNLTGDGSNRFLLDLLYRLFYFNSAYAQSRNLMRFKLEQLLFPRGLFYAMRILRMIRQFQSHRTDSESAKEPVQRHDIFETLANAKSSKHDSDQPYLTSAQVWAELRFLMITGSSVTASSLAGLFWYLSRHPDCQKTLASEIRSTFLSVDEIQFGTKLSSCVYLRACMLETLRLAPGTQGGLFRDLEEGGIVLNDGYGTEAPKVHIPEGYDVGVCLYAIQHNEGYFPDAFSFKPDRWIEQGDKGEMQLKPFDVKWPASKGPENPNAFAAYSHGPRACLGKNLSLNENSTIAARLLWNFEIRAADSQKVPKTSQGRFRDGQFRQKDFLIPEWRGPWLEMRRREGCTA